MNLLLYLGSRLFSFRAGKHPRSHPGVNQSVLLLESFSDIFNTVSRSGNIHDPSWRSLAAPFLPSSLSSSTYPRKSVSRWTLSRAPDADVHTGKRALGSCRTRLRIRGHRVRSQVLYHYAGRGHVPAYSHVLWTRACSRCAYAWVMEVPLGAGALA